VKEILIRTSKNEARGNCSITIYGRNDKKSLFVARTAFEYPDAAAIRNRFEYKEDGELPADISGEESVRKFRTHAGRSEPSGGSGIVSFDSWIIVEVPVEWWEERCGNEMELTEREMERVAAIVRAIRRQMEGKAQKKSQ